MMLQVCWVHVQLFEQCKISIFIRQHYPPWGMVEEGIG